MKIKKIYLWQDHCKILLIILVKKNINLNANMEIIIKNSKFVELITKIASAVLNKKR